MGSGGWLRREILYFFPLTRKMRHRMWQKKDTKGLIPHILKRNRTISKVEHTFYYGHCSVFFSRHSVNKENIFFGAFFCVIGPQSISPVFWGSRRPKKARSHNGRADRKSRKVAEFSPFLWGGNESKPFYSKSKRSISVLKALLNPSHPHWLKKGGTMVHWKKEKGPCHTQFWKVEGGGV